MINLIPNEEKKKKVQDFYFRLAVVFLAILGFSMVIASVMILPSYFLSLVKKNLIGTKLEIQKNEPIPLLDQRILTTVSDLENKLTLIENIRKNKYIVSEQVIQEVLSKKMSDIKITEITYDNVALKGKSINVSGTAPNRERLLLFRKAFEEDSTFKEVNLPISNFIKGSNIRFSLSLIPF